MSRAVEAADDALLTNLWRLQLKTLIGKLKAGDEITAAELSVVRAFLADNGVSRQTLTRLDASTRLQSLEGLDIPAFDPAGTEDFTDGP